jgi:hypothetical protein
MSGLPKKYIPFLILIFLVLFIWFKEAIIVEGYYSAYFHQPEHKLLLLLIRGVDTIVIFVLGYIGLSNLSVKWVKVLWLYWYVVVFIALVLRIVYEISLFHYFQINLLNYLSTIYYIIPTPFPYMILWLLSVIVEKNQLSKKKQNRDHRNTRQTMI